MFVKSFRIVSSEQEWFAASKEANFQSASHRQKLCPSNGASQLVTENLYQITTFECVSLTNKIRTPCRNIVPEVVNLPRLQCLPSEYVVPKRSPRKHADYPKLAPKVASFALRKTTS